jgi:hypothetical protein
MYHTWRPSGDQAGCAQHPPVVSCRGVGGGVLVAVGAVVGSGVAVSAGARVKVAAGLRVGVVAAAAVDPAVGEGDGGGAAEQPARIDATNNADTSLKGTEIEDIGWLTGRPTPRARGSCSG